MPPQEDAVEDLAPPALYLPWPEEELAEGGGEGDADDPDAAPDAAPDGAPGEDRTFDPELTALLPVLRVGLVLDPSAGDFTIAEPFRAALEAGLRIPVMLIAYRDLPHLQRAIIRGEVDYAPLSASAYADAWRRCACLEPLLAPRGEDGATGWHAVALVAAEAPYRDLADLAGARLATSGPGSTAGYRVPFAALREEGRDPETYFEQITAYDGPVAAAMAVLAGKVDVSFGWLPLGGDDPPTRGTLQDVAKERGGASGLRVVWSSGAIGNAPHTIRLGVPVAIRERIAEVLLAPPAPGEAAPLAISPHGFVPVAQADYAPVLATYPQGGGRTGRLRPLRPVSP
ncbi:phosphate/phosphite/phosphonate ABC transporter substrate-binding protein [Stappia indica]|uniref:phosphate/phosphite/phosphonate ABC transporter substrate-binding protein n=1 Tax=Stappia indica TaxID=538381 RepID=UPI001CD2CB9A|nr:PhnD/SsuA/transferrin family substrate-binding protein [Stappia indica]MCA1300803.1 PhnD/SsuA/transferrin family substrate-binding protein [Stappia indica]